MDLFTLTTIYFSYYFASDLYNHRNAIYEFNNLNLRLDNIERIIANMRR